MHAGNRRQFLQQTSAAALAALAARHASAADASTLPDKDPRLVVHVADPPVLETPPALLADSQVTPTRLFFVRNVQPTPRIAAADPLAGWQIELAGLVAGAQTFDAALLRKLPQTEVEMVVQCSGNGRALFSQAAKTDGTQWVRGGMANVRFAGPTLAGVLQHVGAKPQPGARFLTASGRDNPRPGEMDFEHSLPLDEVLAHALVALDLNGRPLPIVHGGPVRLVMPGYYGTMQVKWLARLSCDVRESTHTSHLPHYRTPLVPIRPGDKFEATFGNSEPNWRMRLKSVVLSPAPGEQLPRGAATVVGVAFNDGRARIDSVLLSTDRGRTWQQAELDVPKSPYAWYRWRAHVALAPGAHEIWSRAVDALGRSQPLDGSIYWNPRGYTWNGVEKIPVTVA